MASISKENPEKGLPSHIISRYISFERYILTLPNPGNILTISKKISSAWFHNTKLDIPRIQRK